MIRIVLLLLILSAVTAGAQVQVALEPDLSCLAPQTQFTLTLQITETGAGFNAYETVIEFDPQLVTFVSADQGALMLDPCGNTIWDYHLFESSVLISHVIMCTGNPTVTGPGILSTLTFETQDDTATALIDFQYIDFFVAGNPLPDVVATGATVLIRDNCDLAACCDTEFECMLTSEADCEASGGQWQLEWDSCEPNPCLTMAAPDRYEPHWLDKFTVAPNPLSESTTIGFSLAETGNISISIHSLDGRLIRQLATCDFPAGNTSLRWDGNDSRGRRAAAGAYYCRLARDGAARIERLILLK